MSEYPSLHDRLTGRSVALDDGRTLLGRFTVPDRETGYYLSDRLLDPGEYLAAADRSFLLWHDAERSRVSGDFGPDHTPPPILRENVLNTTAKLAELRASQSPLEEWLAVPALVADADERLRPHPLEDSMREDLPHVQAVCYDPHARLRTDHILEPVSRARRITWRTAVHLAKSSETWAARRLHGVEPARLLTPIQVPNYDLYENRVVVALLGRLWRHVLARAAELDDIDRWLQRGRDFLDAAGSRPLWRERLRLYDALAPVLSAEDIDQRVAHLREQLDALRRRLAQLQKSPLYRSVPTPYSGPAQLRPTNLFLDNGNYRRCRLLWARWVNSYGGGEHEPDAGHLAAQLWCRSFADYTHLLLLRAMKQLGLDMAFDDPVPEPGEPGPSHTYRGETVTLDSRPDDTFVLTRRGRPVLRIVPMPHALTAASERDAIAAAVRQLAVGPVRRPSVTTAVLYPAQPHDRSRLPLPLRLAVSDVFGAEYAGAAILPLVPVGPSDVDSTGRVARLLRTALDAPALLEYPGRVRCTSDIGVRLAAQVPWIEATSTEIRIVRPPRQPDVADLPALLAQLVRTVPRRQMSTAIDPAHLASELAATAETLERLTICPVCQRKTERPDWRFERREDGTYRCECSWRDCGSAWEIRPCQSCTKHYPVLVAAGLADALGGDGDYLDRTFSQDLLATPCWVSSRIYICTRCRRCPEAGDDGIRADCARCCASER